MPLKFCGECVRQAREDAGLLQEQVAARVNRSQPLISLIEIGYRTPSIEDLIELAVVLGVPVESFFEPAEAVHA
jgi:transcriptional regulator with XRE-family HTH domain